MGDKFCAVLTKCFSTCVVDLKTMEVLYDDEKASHVSKQDERTLHIIMKPGCGNNAIYDIETKKYLPTTTGYEFEDSLGNQLYVFRENSHHHKNFYECKRYIINADGKILLKDIEGWISLDNRHLIITKKNEISIIGTNDKSTLEIKTIKQNEHIIAKPAYHNGHIIIIERGNIKIYTPNLELINEIKIDGLEEIINYEIVSDTLKICLPLIIGEEQIGKHLYINLKTQKTISHIRITGYPYWTPTTYIGKDSINSKITNYHFYNANFEPIISIDATSYESVDSAKECMFIIRTTDGKCEKTQLLNSETGSIREIDYTYVKFHPSLPYGYGINSSNETMDFFDENLNIIIPKFNYKEFNLSFGDYKFNYFIVNNYICIINHFIDAYGYPKYRRIIQNSQGDIILDSTEHKCYAIGNLILIISPNDTHFLNTLTGEFENLSLSVPIDEKGNINFKKINNTNYQLLPSSTYDTTKPKEKKLKPQSKNDYNS